MTGPARPVLRYHGGKFRLAPWIIGHFPSHKVYVEPFGGAASVLMQKPRSHGEVYNDLDGDIVNVMRVLQDRTARERLAELVTLTPYARAEFDLAWEPVDDPVERARRTFIRAEMGFGSAGATKGATGFRIDTKRNYGTAMHVWSKVPDKLEAFGRRLQGVLIENRDALQILRDHDTPETLFYVDPPYVHGTRQMGAACYRHEMDDDAHRALLDALKIVQGMVIVSGYAHSIYDEALAGWTRVETVARMAAGRGTGVRIEVLWISPSATGNDLFREVA